MKMLALLFGLFLAAFLGLVSARAGDESGMAQVHHLLKQALGDDNGQVPPPDQRLELLKQARDLVTNAPRLHNGKERKQAADDLAAAIAALQQGEAADKVNGYIRQADSEVRDAEAKARP